MNNELMRALKPVRRRVRRNRLLRGLAFGLAAGAGTALVVRIAALFVPMADKWLWALLPGIALSLLFAAGNALRPVDGRTAAAAADGCGPKERTITALEQAETHSEICELQRADACRALAELDVRRIRPGSVRKPLLAALCCGALLLTLTLIPGPRDREAEARKALRKTLKAGTEEIARAAAEDEERLTAEERNELRRLTEELNRELLGSRDETDALVALGRAEQRLERLQSRTAGDALAAAAAAGNESASGGAENTQTAAGGTENTQSAAGGSKSPEAGQNPGTDSAATASEVSGNPAGTKAGAPSTQKALTALKSAVNPSAAGSADQGASQTVTGQGGDRQGQTGSPGAGGGSGNRAATGAGEGSTNLAQEGGGKAQSGSAGGNRDPKYKEAAYEMIYDPERTEVSLRDEMTNQNRLSDAESPQAETGPGRGNLGGSVPWSEVFRAYEETETQAAERENLTMRERQWVTDYYSLLTEAQ